MTTTDAIKNFVKNKLSTNPKWVERAIIKLFERQTSDEQTSEETNHHNNVGFNGIDAKILSSFAKWLNRSANNHLSFKQLQCSYRILPKYWKQVWSLIPTEKQEELLAKLK